MGHSGGTGKSGAGWGVCVKGAAPGTEQGPARACSRETGEVRAGSAVGYGPQRGDVAGGVCVPKHCPTPCWHHLVPPHPCRLSASPLLPLASPLRPLCRSL